jgi:hypothetical protein
MCLKPYLYLFNNDAIQVKNTDKINRYKCVILDYPCNNGFIHLNRNISKLFYNMFIKKKHLRPVSEERWNNIFNLDYNKIKFSDIYVNKICKIEDKKISEFNYKVLNRILVNRKDLHKWGKTSSNKSILQ